MRCRATRRKWGWSIVYYVWLWTWFFLHNYINSCQSRGIMHSNPEASGFRTGAEFKHFFLSTSNFAEIFQLKIDKWQTLCCKTHICAIYQANFFLVQCCIYRSNLRSPGRVCRCSAEVFILHTTGISVMRKATASRWLIKHYKRIWQFRCSSWWGTVHVTAVSVAEYPGSRLDQTRNE